MSYQRKILKHLALFIALLLFYTIPAYADHFNFSVPSTTNSMVFYGDLFTIDSEISQAGDEIAVFDTQGTLCGHYVVTNAGFFNLSVYGEDSGTPGDQGADLNEDLTFVIYDLSKDLEITLNNSMIVQKSVFGQPQIETIPPKFLGNNEVRGMGIEATSTLPAPTIASISPESAFTSGGGTLNITGTNFQDGASITVGGVSATNVVFNSATNLSCDIPAHGAGTVSIVVENPDNQAVTLTNSFTYELPSPEIVDVDPDSGLTDGGTSVVITGTNFVDGATIYFGAITATNIAFVSSEQLTCETPANGAGVVSITVVNPDSKQDILAEGFEYKEEAPIIAEIIPAKGHVTGDTIIKIYGNNFDDEATVSIHNQNIPVLERTSTYIIAKTLPNPVDLYELTVTNSDGQFDILEEAFQYKEIIASISIPEEAPKTGQAPFHVWLDNNSKGEIEEFFWHFDDEDVLYNDRFEPLVHHVYAEAGVYPITLHVIGNAETDISEALYITVTPNPCDIDVFFTSDTMTSGFAPLTVSFVNETFSDTLEITSWLWDFGDGQTSTEESPTVVYNTGGNHSVLLIATSEDGCTRTHFAENFVSVQNRQITGQVVNKDSAGIANVNVILEVPGANIHRVVTTDENGNYTFLNLPPDDFILIHVDPEGTTYFPNQLENPLSLAEGNAENVQISLYKGGVSGQVKRCLESEIESCIPLPGIDITVLNNEGIFGSCRTDSEGNYTITGIPSGFNYFINIWDEATGTEYFYSSNASGFVVPEYDNATTLLIEDSIRTDTILRLKAGASISGIVTWADGSPAKDIHVNAWSDRLHVGGNATTNEQGVYTIVGITAVGEAETLSKYIVEIHPQGFPYQAYDNKNRPELATPVAAPITNINFTIKSGLSISGKVTVSSGSSQNIEVVAKSQKALFENFALTDSEGNYTIIGLPPADDYIVFAHAPDYPVQFYENQMDEDLANKIDLFDDLENIDFTITKGQLITGIVNGLSFEPEEDTIWVHVWSDSTGTGGDAPTDQDGRYEVSGLDANASDYIIFIFDPEFGQAYYKEGATNNTVYSFQELDFVNGKAQGVAPSENDRNIILQSALYSIKGQVSYNGQPIPGVQVEAWSSANGNWGTSMSVTHIDNTGANYEIKGLISGTYEINIISDKYILNEPQTITISNANIVHMDLAITKPDRSISGTISGLGNGKVVWVSAFSETADYGEEALITGDGNDRNYSIPGLKPAEDYVVTLNSPDYPDIIYNGKTSWFKADRVNVLKESETGINFTLTSDSELATISGNVTVPNGAEAGEEIWIDAFSESSRSNGAVMVEVTANCEDGNGCSYPYTVKALKKSDDYVVICNSEKYQTVFYDNNLNFENITLVDITSTNAQDVNFELNVGYYINGTINNTNSEGLENVEVEAWSESTNSWGIARTDADGNFKIEGLNSASDFVIQALQPDEPPFIYKSGSNHTRNYDYATKVTSVSTGSSDVTIIIVSGYQISGTVQDSTGKGISGIIIAANSQTENVGNHAKTDSSGSYIIKGLPGNATYDIAVEPGPKNSYLRQEKTVNIKETNIKVNFTLSTGYEVSGVIWNSTHEAIVEAEVFLHSISTGYDEFVASNQDGEYSFKGVPSGSDYVIVVETSDDYLIYLEEISVTGNLTSKTINLTSAAGKIRGYIYKNDGITAIPDVAINIYSESTGFQRFGILSNYRGYYEINGLPTAIDYVVEAIPEAGSGYASDFATGKSPGDVVNFTLASGGSIKGVVQTAAGTKLEDVYVFLSSSSLNISYFITRTDSNGNYSFDGLQSSPTSDYVVTIDPIDQGYPIDEKTGLNISDTESVDFYLNKGDLTTISGTVKDSTETLASEGFVKVRIYTSAGLKIADVLVDANGAFEFTTLDPDTKYMLKFMSRDRALSLYAAEDGTDVTKDNAYSFSTGSVVNFQYSGTWQ